MQPIRINWPMFSLPLALTVFLMLQACAQTPSDQDLYPQESLALEIHSANFPTHCDPGTDKYAFKPDAAIFSDSYWFFSCRQVMRGFQDIGNRIHMHFSTITVNPRGCTFRYAEIAGWQGGWQKLSYCPREQINAILGESPATATPYIILD